jgi:outer membrane protein assembly factor BamB
MSLLWSKENIYPVWNTFDTTIDALNGMVCFLGGLDRSTDNNIVCLNSKSGELLWQKQSGHHNSIVMMPDAIYVSYYNLPGIKRFDNSGKEVWNKHLPGTGTDYLYVVGDHLQVLTVPENFTVLDFQANELDNLKDEKIFISVPEGEFISLNGIQLAKASEVIWQYNYFDDVLEMAPLFTETKVFVRTGQQLGSIYSLDRKSGQLLWKTNGEIVSNVVYSPANQVIYALSRDGKLLSMNENDGSVNVLAEFSSTPFVLNGEENVGCYQLAYDPNESVLFVSIGDSRQLFAFDIR